LEKVTQNSSYKISGCAGCHVLISSNKSSISIKINVTSLQTLNMQLHDDKMHTIS